MSFHWADVEWCSECDNSLMDIGTLPNGDCPYCGNDIECNDKDELYFTNAPKSYDYAPMTEEVIADTGYRLTSGCDQDKPVRMLRIKDKGRADFQKGRNLSGLYPTLTSYEFTEWVMEGFVERDWSIK